MTDELKTLKDLAFNGIEYFGEGDGTNDLVEVEKLKAEAIKWIEHIKLDIKEIHNLESKPQSPLQKMATQGLDEILDGQIKWIKMFFNITKENLK